MKYPRKGVALSHNLAVLVVGVSALASGALGAPGRFVPGELIVKYRSTKGVDIQIAREQVAAQGRVLRSEAFSGLFAGMEHFVFESNTDVLRLASAIEATGLVEYAEPNFIVGIPERRFGLKSGVSAGSLPCLIPGILPPGCTAEPAPSAAAAAPAPALQPAVADPATVTADPGLARMVGFNKLNLMNAWQKSTGSRRILVAVIDSGVDYNHEDLSGNLWRAAGPDGADTVGYNFVNNTALPFDDNGHGTHVSGTIGAVGFNGVGVSGVAPRVSIAALKFLDGEGHGATSNAIRALQFAVRIGARVINNSWGGPDGGRALKDAIERTQQAGALFVVAAGNESNDNDGAEPAYPASYHFENIISVAATDGADQLADFSNYGHQSVNIAAPGVRILSSVPGNRYGYMSGTSMAAPQVSGAAVLVLAKHPNWTYAQVKEALLNTVDRIGDLNDKVQNGGRMSIVGALER